MAKPWVEGGYYEECSEKWGWKNKEREITKEKWRKKSWKKSKKKIFENVKIQAGKEKSHLHTSRKKGE